MSKFQYDFMSIQEQGNSWDIHWIWFQNLHFLRQSIKNAHTLRSEYISSEYWFWSVNTARILLESKRKLVNLFRNPDNLM